MAPPPPMHTEYAEGLDPATPLTDGRVWGVLARPKNDGTFGTDYFAIPILPSSKDWTPAPTSSKLGFPLQIHQLDTNQPPDTHEGQNHAAMNIMIDADEASPQFGCHPKKTWKGDILIIRTDGHDMYDYQFDCLSKYIHEKVGPVLGAMFGGIRNGTHSPEDLQRFREIVGKRMRPEAFHACFEEARGLRRWRDVVSPVSVTYGEQAIIAPACGNCFGMVGNDGAPLKKCKGCGVAYYCNRHCQGHEWATHRQWCGE